VAHLATALSLRGAAWTLTRGSAWFLATALFGCTARETGTLTVDAPPLQSGPAQLTIRSAHAELLEGRPSGYELRIVLDSQESPCDAPPSSNAQGTRVLIIARSPQPNLTAPAEFPIVAEPAPLPVVDPALAPGPRPGATLGARLALRSQGRTQPLDAGGTLTLSELDLRPGGVVRGAIEHESSGDASHPATSLRGSFLARWCRLDPGLVPAPSKDGAAKER